MTSLDDRHRSETGIDELAGSEWCVDPLRCVGIKVEQYAAVIAAGLITAVTFSFWPDLIVGIGIAIMNADAAKEIWKAAKEEKAQLEVEP